MMIFILILILVLIYFYIHQEYLNEYFLVYWSGSPIEPLEYSVKQTNWPFWNSRVGQTTNMSYDLRGEPLTIPKYPFMWNYSTLTPIQNKKLC